MSDVLQHEWSPPASDPSPGPPPGPATPPPPAATDTDGGPGRRRRWPRLAGALLVLAAVAFGGGLVGALIADDDGPSPTVTPAAGTGDEPVAQPVSTRSGSLDVAAVAAEVAPSVVTVISDLESSPFGEGSSIGTGVFTTAEGEILTNAHVVNGASEIRVRLAGETEPRQAELLALDVGNDLALLQLDADGLELQPATLADPDDLAIGQDVLAIGFALDLDGAPSVTLGIVSATDRTILTSEGALDGLIQTDAAISSGNSGGPLVNSAGQVVGINTAVARGDFTVAATNIGFAISMAEAGPVIEQLREQAGGEARQEAYLGVGPEDRRDGGQGALIVEVEEGAPAEAAGIEVDDVVVAVNGEPVVGSAGLIAAIRDLEPGTEVEVTLTRGGEEVTVTATLVARPDQP